MFKIGLHCPAVERILTWSRVTVWGGVGWWWWCKVIIISNPTAVEVVLSCIEVVVGVLTIALK